MYDNQKSFSQKTVFQKHYTSVSNGSGTEKSGDSPAHKYIVLSHSLGLFSHFKKLPFQKKDLKDRTSSGVVIIGEVLRNKSKPFEGLDIVICTPIEKLSAGDRGWGE